MNSHMLKLNSIIGLGLFCCNLNSFAAPVNACVSLVKTTDPAGHGCCVKAPPEKLSININNTSIEFSSSESQTWLPLSGSNNNGQISLEGMSTVAGFPDVTTTFNGTQSNNIITGSFTIGAKGKLPQAQPIIYEVSMDTSCGQSIGCNGTYKDANMEIVINNDLMGTVTSPTLGGSFYGVKQYDNSDTVCFVSAFVKPNQGPECNIVVAGRLEVKTIDGVQQGMFDFGGGNTCNGLITPFSFTLPKIK